MPIIDLNTPTEILLQWGWLLVSRANGVVYVLLVLVFLLGALIGLPHGKARPPVPGAGSGSGDAPEGGDRA
jgi:hypothetical protein